MTSVRVTSLDRISLPSPRGEARSGLGRHWLNRPHANLRISRRTSHFSAGVLFVLGVLLLLPFSNVQADRSKERELLGKDFRLELEAARSLDEAADAAGDAGDYPKAIELIQEALRLTEANLGPRHRNVVQLKINLADAYRQAGDPTSALRLANEAHQLAISTLETGQPLVAATLNAIGVVLMDTGKLDDAREKFLAVLAKGEDNSLAVRIIRTAAESNLGTVLEKKGDFSAALPHLNAAQAAVESLFGRDDQRIAIILSTKSAALINLGELEEASRTIETSLTILRKHLAEGHPDYIYSLGNAASLYWNSGSTEKALSLSLQALSIAESKLGRNHLIVAKLLSNLATIYSSLGRVSEALQASRQALAIRESNLGPAASEVADSLLNLAGIIFYQLGETLEAEALITRCLNIYLVSNDSDVQMKIEAFNLLAQCLAKRGRFHQAIKALSTALQLTSDADLEEGILLRIGENLAVLLDDDDPNGVELLEKTIGRKRKILGANHPDLCLPLLSLANLCSRRGQIPQSRKALVEAVRISRESIRGYSPVKRDVFRAFAQTLAADGHFGPSHEIAAGCLDLTRLHVFQQSQYLGTAQVSKLASKLRSDLDLLASLVSSTPESSIRSQGSRRLGTELAACKGLILEAEAAHARLSQNSGDNLKEFFQQYQRYEAALAVLEREASPTDRAELRKVLLAKQSSLRDQCKR